MRPVRILLGATCAVAATALAAHAFCCFYVAGSNTKMFNDATQVVLMRDGTRTVLAMQNDYRGPLEDFAMVVPVPVVLKPTDVRVVDKGVFERLDSLGSPRLVEYWEQDPCPAPIAESRAYPRAMPAPEPKMARDAPMTADEGGYERAEKPKEEKRRKSVPPVLASFAASKSAVTAGVATPVTWTFSYSNTPYPTPTCAVDHGVGTVYSGNNANLTLNESSTLTLT